ncbi:hypothetical protein H257_12363 [Aphanomyces astaci]|uniref:Uncharacterized protein n=1 Tax=Aphanomyces astaci TaxID=112090 RepID=W4G016_APHAT|nr:hypothetical protein H257_12363 [Aphanomyces astaci]ETV72606.1 hypothetical protein H257_12363 [Aphanomyces astaci]|eukprot:XP_009837834.1 hypothetical protein H257_12363 [Aphanomyces astaci]
MHPTIHSSKSQLSYILHPNNSDDDDCTIAATPSPPASKTSPTPTMSMAQLDLSSPQSSSISPARPPKSSSVKLMYNRVRQRGVRQKEKVERQLLRQQVETLQVQLRHLQAKQRQTSAEGRRMRFYGLQRWQGPAAAPTNKGDSAAFSDHSN